MFTKIIKIAIGAAVSIALIGVNVQLLAQKYAFPDPTVVPAEVAAAGEEFISHQQDFQTKYQEWDPNFIPTPEGYESCFMGDNPRHGLLSYSKDGEYFTVVVSTSQDAEITSVGTTDLAWALCTTGEVHTIDVQSQPGSGVEV